MLPKLEIVLIPQGTGQHGSPTTEESRMDDEDLSSIQLDSFFMSKYPITQNQWKAVAALPKVKLDLEPEPAFFKGANRPVERISWYEAIEFCARLTQVTGRLYRLPTEVEWEYACRAGTTTPFHFGETLSTDWANYNGEDHYGTGRSRQGILYKGSYGQGATGINRKETTEVSHFQTANAFGLYDMHGNVWEWCEGEGDQRPLRGGSWKSTPGACRSAFRMETSPADCNSFIGFRVVCYE
jgi:formylglycine-generating enzyme required for sulfatase activity